MFFGKHLLKIDKDVDEPSNILWENQDVSNSEFYVRKVVSYLLIALILCFSVLFLLAANVVTGTNSKCTNAEYKEEDLTTVLATKNENVI